MINIKCYASGSKGNIYLVSTNNSNIILECGVNEEKIRQIMNKNKLLYSNINACIASHFHQDHSMNIKLFDDYDIPCYCTFETKNKYGISKDNFIKLEDKKIYIINNDIKVMSFNVMHGDAECFGFIFNDKEDTILFITDFMCLNKNLSNFKFNKIFIECNYIEDIIENKISNDNDKYKRQINTHMSLENLVYLLSSNLLDLSKCKEINLIHLSKELSNYNLMKNTIENELKIKTNCILYNGEIY